MFIRIKFHINWLTQTYFTAFLYVFPIAPRIYGILDESTETTKSYSNFNDDLRWMWNSVNNNGIIICKIMLEL